MAVVLEKIIQGTNFVYRLDSFPVFCGYILMVILAGLWKRFTKPVNIRPVLVAYNLTASALSLYTLYIFCKELYQAESTFEPQTTDQLKFAYRIYWHVKKFELLDTVFMVIRHKQRQISFLHVYHHGSMLLLSDVSCNFYPYVSIATYLGLNSAVHVLLYFYYGLSAMYPDNPPQWKKILTQFQIIQFIIDLAHATIGYIYHNFCIFGLYYCLAMIILFSNFYFKAYSKEHRAKNKSDKISNKK